jgi:hypothetical protein
MFYYVAGITQITTCSTAKIYIDIDISEAVKYRGR